MKPSIFLAVSSLVASICASPHARHLDLHKREVIHTFWEKVVVTKTITLMPGQHPPNQDQYQPKAEDAKKAPAENFPAQSTPESHPIVHHHHHEQYQPPKQQQKAAPVQPAASPATVNKPAEDRNSQPQPQPTTPAYVPPPSTTAQQSPSISAGGSAGGSGPSGGACGSVGGKCSGDVTMYNDQGSGACGWTNNTNTDEFFALAIGMFGTYTNDAPGPHKNAYCGRKANIVANGQTVSGTLTDACGGCTGQSIDLSQALWNKLYPGQAGTRYSGVEWYFTDAEIYSGPGY